MAAWKKWLNSQFDGQDDEAPVTLADVREQVMASIGDCQGPMSERMRWRLENTQTAQDLWLLRSELFQLIANQHCQAEAATRINALLPVFEGWVPSRLLTTI